MTMVWSPDYLGSPGKMVLSNPLTCTNTPKGENKLYSDAKGVVPSLDLRFAEGKNLNDYMTGTPLVDHQRSMNSSTFSPGTFVNSNGLIETAKANYALYSETLTASWWSGGQFISISDTTDVNPPTGIQNIYKVTETADTGEHFFRGSQVNLAVTAGVPNGTVVTISIYLNTSLGRSKVRVYSFGQNNLTFIWDLVNNAQIGTISGGTSPTINSQSLGNNWYRFSFTDTATTSSNFRPVFQTVNNLNQFNYAGDTTKGFYASGFQVEIGTTATTYIPTTTSASAAPRFDHNPTTGESLGLLIEESRTNILLNSATLSTQSVTTSATAYTLSFYGTGTVTLSGTSTAGPLAGTGANDRVTLTFTPTAGTLTLTVTGTVSNAQLEAGSFPTSYIPTTGTALTRSADDVSISGSNFSSWYNQSEGTVFAESKVQDFTATNFPRIASLDRGDGSANFAAIVRSSAINKVEYSVFAGTGQAVGLQPPSTFTSGSSFRAAGIYKVDDFIAAANGTLSPVDTTGSVPTSLTTLGIGMQGNGTLHYNGTIRRLTYFPDRLEDSVLQAITQ